MSNTTETLPGTLDAIKDLSIGSPELEALQFEKLKKLLVYVYEESDYYKKKFDEAGVSPYEFTSLDQYKDYPMFDKYEERDSQAKSIGLLGHPLGMHVTCDMALVNRMCASSGTSGAPSFQGHTASDRDIIQRNFTRLAEFTDLKPGDKVLMAGVMSMWVAGIPSVDALMNFGANVIPIGGLVGTKKVIDMLLLTKPDHMVCTPSFALTMLRKAEEEYNLDLASAGLKAVGVYGEPGGSIPEVINKISEGFGGVRVYDMAGGTGCLNPLFVSCGEHNGMHFIAPDHAYIELYDRETDTLLPWEDGAEGEFVYTGLDRECGPLIRFKDGDRIKVHLDPCKCGRPGMRISMIGRVDDMMLIKGVNVFPSAIRDLIIKVDQQATGSVRVVKKADSHVVEPPLLVKVEYKGLSDENAQAIKESFESEIQRQLRFRANVELYKEGDLPLETGVTGKAKIIEEI